MRGEEDRLTGRFSMFDNRVERVQAIRIERRGRFVEEQHRRCGHQGHGETQALNHPAGIRRDRTSACAVERGELERGVGMRVVDLPQTSVEFHDFATGERLRKRHPLRQERQHGACVRIGCREPRCPHPDFPGRRSNQARSGLQRRRLPRSIGSEQRHRFAWFDLQRQIVHGGA